jgi:hypothetical protein
MEVLIIVMSLSGQLKQKDYRRETALEPFGQRGHTFDSETVPLKKTPGWR